MSSCRKNYTADFFKKDEKSSVVKDSDHVSKDLANDFEEKISLATGGETSNEEIVNGGNFDFSQDTKPFNNEDNLMAKLIRQVTDEIQKVKRLQKLEVKRACKEIGEEIEKVRATNYTIPCVIDFVCSAKQCAYLRHCALSCVGLVKMAMWKFFSAKQPLCEKARNDILNSEYRNVVSLGGGPGSDLIGFCAALQEIPNKIKELDLKIVDISNGWKSVFPVILRTAGEGNFGSVNAFIKKVKIKTGFLQRDLCEDRIFQDEALSCILSEADIVLMAKLVSFRAIQERRNLIRNVVAEMKEGAYLIFIDYPYDRNIFYEIRELDVVYEEIFKYKLSSQPSGLVIRPMFKTKGSSCVFIKKPLSKRR